MLMQLGKLPFMLPLMEGLKEINYEYRKNSIVVE
jgi:hypothetical protein